jgi:hypothetical protein
VSGSTGPSVARASSVRAHGGRRTMRRHRALRIGLVVGACSGLWISRRGCG